MWMAWILAGSAMAGDLWLTMEKPTEDVTVRLPADWLLEEGDPVRLETRTGPVELRHEARRLERGTASWSVQQDDGFVQVTLGQRATTGEAATQLRISALGPLGMGLNLSLPLEVDRLGDARSKLAGAVDIDGLEVDLDDAATRQLRRSPPTVLLEIVEDGNTFRIATE